MIKRTMLILLVLVSLVYAFNTYWPLLSEKPEEEGKLAEILKSRPEAVIERIAPTTEEAKAELKEAEKYMEGEIEQLADPFALRISVTRKAGRNGKTQPQVIKPQELKLEGIWMDSGLQVAFISGQAVTEGGVVLGWRVKKIEKNEVLLVKGERSKILRLEE